MLELLLAFIIDDGRPDPFFVPVTFDPAIGKLFKLVSSLCKSEVFDIDTGVMLPRIALDKL